MKKIILIRHSKSDWDKPFTEDKERGLSKRGLQNAICLEKVIRKTGLHIDIGYISNSVRTVETYKVLTRKKGFVDEVIFTDRIYEAQLSSLVYLTRETSDKNRSSLLLGHNPGLEEFANFLLGTESVFFKIPTSAMIQIVCEVDTWKKVKRGCGKLHSLWV
jgi:phosphohistidine phosphatase